MSIERYTNRLIHEKSPYLLQHAHNPVDWYPWGEEAFEKARTEGKIILLSIGYSTCHWCHVMERESFEDPDVAAVINSLTVPIKVDREERPDVDQVYMSVCQALTGHGGWPLNVLLTPERLPFYAGTYFPKETRHGRIGLMELLRRAAALWEQDPERLKSSGRELVDKLQTARSTADGGGEWPDEVLAAAQRIFRSQFDEKRGGFGTAPKFPTPHNLTFLLRRYRWGGDSGALPMVERTLDAMRRGGIFDHVGLGFHRYSTDAQWLLPHFEKMLYDQAGLALAYLEAYQATRNREHAQTARDIFTYVLRDLTGPEGAFYSAEDADSEGVEGKFYVWTREEIIQVLGAKEGQLFCQVFGVREEGNFREEATGERTGANILYLESPLAVWAKENETPLEDFEARMDSARKKLFENREQRIRPHRDDKIIAAWNGLMISALARGAWALEEAAYAEAAGKAADFLLETMRPEGRLLRRYRDGEAAVPAFAEDYAFLARGLLDLYGATLEIGRLAQAMELAHDVERLFWDDADGGLFDTASDAEQLVLRPKEVYDGATPSANSVALELFARLGLLTGDSMWTDRARAIMTAFTDRVSSYPAGFSQFLQGASLLLEPTREVVVVGDPGSEDTAALLQAIRSAYSPETSTLFVPSGEAGQPVSKLASFTSAMTPSDGRAAAYVCQSFACQAPITDPEELSRTLERPP